jgi:hypothetical protein
VYFALKPQASLEAKNIKIVIVLSEKECLRHLFSNEAALP